MTETTEHSRTTHCQKGWSYCIYCAAGTPHCMCGWVPVDKMQTGKQWEAQIDEHIADPAKTEQYNGSLSPHRP